MGIFNLFKKKKNKEAQSKPSQLTPSKKVDDSASTSLYVPEYENNFNFEKPDTSSSAQAKKPTSEQSEQKYEAVETVPEKKQKNKKSNEKSTSGKKNNSSKKTAVNATNKQDNSSINGERPDEKELDNKKDAATARKGRFEIKKTKDDRYVFNLYASNHVIVATSQVYSSSSSALTGIKSVIANADKAGIEDQTLKNYQALPYPKWEIYLDNGNQYRFRLSASNGSCVCHSQGYTKKSNCKSGIESIQKFAPTAEIYKAYLKK